MQKTITNKEDLHKSIKVGMSEIASIVARTLGPGGLPVLIERRGQTPSGDPLGPMITKDGVTVASECANGDPTIDTIIQSVKSICQKTNRVVGDGTTTAIVLGRAILEGALEAAKTQNPQQVRRDIEAASLEVESRLSEIAIECTSDMVEYIATISANGDKEIGSIIKKAFDAVGSEGAITVDTGHGKNHSLDIVNGFQIRRGAEAQDRLLNNSEKTKFETENCHVILYDGVLNSPQNVLHALQLLSEHYQNKMPPVLFIANEFSQDVIQMLLMNNSAGLQSCAVRSPHQTKVTTQWLDDMAVFLGGTRMGNGNRNLANLELDDIGIADKVVVEKYVTTLYGGAGLDEAVLERIDQLKAQRNQAESEYDSSIISDRLAALAEGIAKIGVGGLTDLEVKEKYHRIEDAINAARAAIEGGIVAGGGSTLLRLSETFTADTVGHKILRKALKAPFRQILRNLGKEEADIDWIQARVLEDPAVVYDGELEEVQEALRAGIIDPVKVTKTALSNAVSISSLLSTAGGAIVFDRKT